jgi:hypothetical protein
MVYDAGPFFAMLQEDVGRVPRNKRHAKEFSEGLSSSSDSSDGLLELFDSSTSDADETFVRISGLDRVFPPCVPPSITIKCVHDGVLILPCLPVCHTPLKECRFRSFAPLLICIC